MTDPLLETGASPPDSAHYLRAVTDMADRCAVVTQDAIYTDSGIKLVEKGARIDSRLYDRLVQHKLREPIDTHLSVEHVVDAAALMAAAKEVLDSFPLPRLLAQALGMPERLVAPLRFMPLPHPTSFKLTVMREQRPDLYQHSLQLMMVALFLGIKNDMSERECVPLAAAAMLHDVGVLHMDPAWRDPQYKVMGAERKHLAAHPVTAMLMAREARVYPRSVEVAVLEHHERMDGTGYPRGIAGSDISPMGQILLLAEVVTAFYEKNIDMPAQQLSLALRLNHRKFPADLVGHLLPLLHEGQERDPSLALPAGVRIDAVAHALVDVFRQWEQAKSSTPGMARALERNGPAAFVEERLRALLKALTEAGAHPDHQALLIEQLQGDAEALAEVAFVVHEALWQIESTINGCQWRWPAPGADQPVDAAVGQWCHAMLVQVRQAMGQPAC